MRLGVIDVGSNTVHLLVVDAHPGAQPLPASEHKIDLRLSEHVADDGRIADDGRDRLAEFVAECAQLGEDRGAEDVRGFATSAIREAPNGDAVLAHVRERTGIRLDVLSGADEARLTFLAARRWFGWSAGTLLV
ncbi:MAG: Ppx/GppA phosphatase family protein, partial [Phycicoccus sp.]